MRTIINVKYECAFSILYGKHDENKKIHMQIFEKRLNKNQSENKLKVLSRCN